MEYALCKKLKEAGFPQRESDVGDFDLCQHNNGELHDRNEECEVIIVPTLEELIEACGEEFGDLSFAVYENDGTEENPKRNWLALPKPNGIARTAHVGNSPSEAVANLWLALNQPVHNSTSTKDTK